MASKKERKEKLDFVDFIKDVSENASLRKKFIKELQRSNLNEQDLHKFLHELGYEGVTLRDCSLAFQLAKAEDVFVAKAEGILARPYEPKY